MSVSMSTSKSEAAKVFLPLSSASHKGSSGRIGVLGGSARYTGAPYYAAMSALRVGADLAYVFCADEAAVPIKCYSPELMVAPVYSAREFDSFSNEGRRQELINKMVEEVEGMMNRMHVLIIGPGLGRCPLVMEATAKIMTKAKIRSLFMVVDADALFLLTMKPYRNLLESYDKVVLTPNIVEYNRLVEAHNGEISKATKSGLIIKKGSRDVIEQGGCVVFECEEEGGLKRSGGLGDILAGAVGTFMAWGEILNLDPPDRAPSCLAACSVTKRATRVAFNKKRRAMTAPDVLDEMGSAANAIEDQS